MQQLLAILKGSFGTDINNREILERYRCRQRETNNILRCEKRKYVKCMIDGAEME